MVLIAYKHQDHHNGNLLYITQWKFSAQLSCHSFHSLFYFILNKVLLKEKLEHVQLLGMLEVLANNLTKNHMVFLGTPLSS